MKKQTRISKFLSYILRHDPSAINSVVDAHGFLQININELVKRMRDLKQFQNLDIQISDIIDVVNRDSKGRYELVDDKIRARYGHSIDDIHIILNESEVPMILFHGTIKENLAEILEHGLKPMGRNLVHLTETIKDAISTGKRHGQNIVILKIDAKKAVKNDIIIRKPGKNVYTAIRIPAEFISLFEE